MKTLRDFSDQFGLLAVIRRHFKYEVPEGLQDMVGGYPARGAMTYTRVIERNLLPLTSESCLQAKAQAEALAGMGLVPSRIHCGTDQRNIDGARWSAAGIKSASGQNVRWYQCPAWTYPYYRDVQHAKAIIERFGDAAVHRYLAGDPETKGLWVETRVGFEARMLSAVLEKYEDEGYTLWDLNFEQMVLLYHRLVAGLQLNDIPLEGPNYWEPKYGGGVAISGDQFWAVEFDANLNLVGEPHHIQF